MGKKKTNASCEHEGIANADWNESMLLSEVASHLRQRTGEIAKAFEHLQTWDSYLCGYESGMLAGLRIAEDLIQCMSDRVMAAGTPWLSEPYPLSGLGNIP